MHKLTTHATDGDANLSTSTLTSEQKTRNENGGKEHRRNADAPRSNGPDFAWPPPIRDAAHAVGTIGRQRCETGDLRARDAHRRDADAPRGGGYETAVMMPALMQTAALCVALLAMLALLPGCALLNESSAAQRADTYDVFTELQFNPRTGQIKAKSSGNDSLRIKGAKFGDNSIDELELVFDRAAVVRAQGERARDMTELMGQQIQLNAEWRMALTESLREIRGIAGDLSSAFAPILGAARSTQTRISTPWGDFERGSNTAGAASPTDGWRGAANATTQPAGR